VSLFSDNVRAPAQVARAVAALQDAAARGGNPPLLIAVDQEGGDVRRLPWAPPHQSAVRMGGDPASALRQGAAAGRALRKVGINLDLAPVLDVPAVQASFLGSRAFGRTPEAVGRAGCAFAAGLRRGGVLTAAKHFPGLGYARANTDLVPVAIDTPAQRLRSGYRPYRECLRAGVVNVVMVSNAAYPRLGARVPAVLSRTVVRDELRGRVGFHGVVMSDSLSSPAVGHVPDATAKAARASVDILLYPTNEAASAAAFDALLSAVRSRTVRRQDVSESAQRIRALKGADVK